MPILLSESTVDFQRSDFDRRCRIDRPDKSAPRTPGIHLSGVLSAVAIEIGVLKPGEPWEEDMPLRMVAGHMWEEFAASLYPDMVWQPGEVCQDDVWMTPDGLVSDLLPQCDGLREFKATWKKVKSGQAELFAEWYWMKQGQGYCKGYGVRHVEWNVFFVNGDYRNSGPIYKKYLVEFSQREIDQTWQMVLNHRHLAVAE